MKNRILLLIALLSLMAFTFACGGAPANNSSNANANKANTMSNMSNMSSNTMSNMSNSSNTMSNSMTNTASNSMANRPANTSANKTPPPANAANKIATTQKPPKGATAKCKDGTYSFSTTASGQCSGHGGVDKKY